MKKNLSVSVIIAMKNSATTVLQALKSVSEQKYEIHEIIIIDNVSSDNSVAIVKKFLQYNKKINIRIISNKTNYGVGGSYNIGAKKATGDVLVFMHSDSVLPSANELGRLLKPLRDNKSVIATFSTILNPYEVWTSFNFWQKLLFARAVGVNRPGMNGKFDAVVRSIFTKIGGFNDISYGENIGVGGEDADLHIRLSEIGTVVLSEASVIHLHYLKDDYSLNDYIKNRKLLARTYGRLMRVQGYKEGKGALYYLIKPALCLMPFLPFFGYWGAILIVAYSFFYTKNMFVYAITLFDWRIIFVPFINIYLLYYETFWLLHSFFKIKKGVY